MVTTLREPHQLTPSRLLPYLYTTGVKVNGKDSYSIQQLCQINVLEDYMMSEITKLGTTVYLGIYLGTVRKNKI